MSTATTTPTVATPERAESPLIAYAKNYGRKLRGGDLGALPAVAGLVFLCALFTILNPAFLAPLNIANLFTQAAPITVIAMGLVFVLLLGEIDLSAGFTSGVCAAVLAILLTNDGWPWYAACGVAIVTGAAIGALLGFLVAKVGIPSFVVTLAAFLAFQGVVLRLLKEGTNISIRDNQTVIIALENEYLSPMLGWAFVAVAVLGLAAVQIVTKLKRTGRGLASDPWEIIALRIGSLAILLGVAVAVLNEERSRNPAIFGSLKGLPIIVPIIAVLLVFWTIVLRRTRFGRHVYAVGGNMEAARRAGIRVDTIRIAAFVICSSMAAIGGIVAVSQARSVDPNTGGSNVLLYAVGAAVIGGTSLFGGRGRIFDAVLGGLVVAVIVNGLGLLGLSSWVKYVFTGSVLLAAAGVDALFRRRSATS
ncbi:MAG: ABC transporter permease [Hamadaea sp.]|nr:ABC transporter permease [Hamadaea sp.]NUR49350.1 ABC transporter permease [Hamadaea sp.]NUT05081.1 ABC transporter permease [Hamadaea sp.]